MTTFVAVSNLDTRPLPFRSDLDVISATVEAARVIQVPAVSDQDKPGTSYVLSWWLTENGEGRVVIDRLTSSGRKHVRERVETFSIRENRAEVPFEVVPPRRAQNRSVAASGGFWTDGSATVTDSDGISVRLVSQKALTRFAIAAAKAGFVIRKVSA